MAEENEDMIPTQEAEESEGDFRGAMPQIYGWWALGPTERQMINSGMRALKAANKKGRKPGTPLTPQLQRAFGMRKKKDG